MIVKAYPNKSVIPAEAGIQKNNSNYMSADWIPASVGMTNIYLLVSQGYQKREYRQAFTQ
jgi:hypothetical protein